MLKNITILLVAVSFCTFCNSDKKQKIIPKNANLKISKINTEVIEKDNVEEDLVKIDFEDFGFIEKMVYASPNNFTKQKIYPCAACYLIKEVADALLKVQEKTKKLNLRIVIFDCYRPHSLQKKMFDLAKNPDYVADPKKVSKHNRGCAVDVGLADFTGKLLDMGTEFDDFSEDSHYANTDFDNDARKNRKILRDVMVDFGFVPYDKEWWHFNFQNTNYPASNFVWNCY